MIIQTAPGGNPRRAVMMHEHTHLSGQFARAFGNDVFEAIAPLDLVVYIIGHHDAGWAAFDLDPMTDPASGLPFNLTETPAEHIAPTSKGSPDFNSRHHAYCGLLSSMHSWGIYNGRYGLSKMVLVDRIPPEGRPLVNAMLDAELARQATLKIELAKAPDTAAWIEEKHLFQNYKQLQFCDTLALYFNRVHPSERVAQAFEHVPLTRDRDTTVMVTPRDAGVYALAPFPFACEGATFAFAGRAISPGQHDREGGWSRLLAKAPTEWETFKLVAG